MANSMSDSTPITSARSTPERSKRRAVRAAMRGKIEAIHRARDVQVAIRVERAHEAPRVSFKIALDGELGRERPLLTQLIGDR